MVRLAFATAIQVDAEILLIDEVLAVGDAAFQQKCFDEFFRLKREGRTILFVSHDMYSVERFCDRAMLMDHGRDDRHRRPGRDRARLPRAELRPARPRGARRDATRPAATHDRRRVVRGRGGRADRAIASAGARADAVLRGAPRRGARATRCSRSRCAPRSAHTIIVARSDEHGASTGSFDAGETVVVRFAIPNWLTAEPLHADAVDRARGHRRGRARAASRTWPRSWSTAPRTTGGILEVPRALRGASAGERGADRPDSGRDARAPRRLRPVRARRRPAALLVADVHARAHRIQAALLRLDPRLRLDADAPAAVLRRDPAGLHEAAQRRSQQDAPTTRSTC